MIPDPEAVVVSVTWRKATAGERQEAGLVMVSYADGAVPEPTEHPHGGPYVGCPLLRL